MLHTSKTTNSLYAGIMLMSYFLSHNKITLSNWTYEKLKIYIFVLNYASQKYVYSMDKYILNNYFTAIYDSSPINL